MRLPQCLRMCEMTRLLLIATAVLLLATPVRSKNLDEMFPELASELYAEDRALLAGMDFRQGTVTIGNGLATIELPDDYYFLDAEDARLVLTAIWGNPPGNTTLGMIFPADGTPLHDVWGVEITFDDIGYVPDVDAAGYDYDDLMKTMQTDLVEENAWRRANGYYTLSLVGWAAEPRYDMRGHKLYWAKELSVDGEEANTLNYNIRILGRNGVLVLNFIAAMYQFDEVNRAVPEVLAMANFSKGNRYEDFDPSLDTVADVSMDGLITGDAEAQTGLLPAALLLLKKFWFLALLLPLLWWKRLFSKREP